MRLTQSELDLYILHTISSTTLGAAARDRVFKMTREIQELWREKAGLEDVIVKLSTPGPCRLPGSY